MYWQKRFDRSNPDEKEEKLILEIRATNKDYGYRRICGELHNHGFIINKKKVQRIMQNLSSWFPPIPEKAASIVLIKERLAKWHLIV